MGVGALFDLFTIFECIVMLIRFMVDVDYE